jgi:hypothetical protein
LAPSTTFVVVSVAEVKSQAEPLYVHVFPLKEYVALALGFEGKFKVAIL